MKYLIPIFAVLLLSSCANKNMTSQMVGNDRDPHGCIPSAGYSWSEVRKDCIQVFNDGVQVVDSRCDSTLATYAVFASDSSRVEIFAPYTEKNAILSRKGKSGTWTNGKQTLAQVHGKLTLLPL